VCFRGMSYSTTVWYWLRHQELAPTVETISQKLFLGRNTYRLDSLQRDHVTQICVSWSRRCNSGFRKYTDAPCTRLWFVNSSIELIFLHLLRTPCQMWPNNRNITIWILTHYRVLWCHTRCYFPSVYPWGVVDKCISIKGVQIHHHVYCFGCGG